MSKYTIQTSKALRSAIQNELCALGVVEDNWPDGSFDFRVHDEQCEDELQEWADTTGTKIKFRQLRILSKKEIE